MRRPNSNDSEAFGWIVLFVVAIGMIVSTA